MDIGRCAGIFAERPTEWIAVSNPSAGNQRFNNIYAYCMFPPPPPPPPEKFSGDKMGTAKIWKRKEKKRFGSS